jgi:hypothetical protein
MTDGVAWSTDQIRTENPRVVPASAILVKTSRGRRFRILAGEFLNKDGQSADILQKDFELQKFRRDHLIVNQVVVGP